MVQEQRLPPQILIQVELFKLLIVDNEEVEYVILLVLEDCLRLGSDRVVQVEQVKVVLKLAPR